MLPTFSSGAMPADPRAIITKQKKALLWKSKAQEVSHSNKKPNVVQQHGDGAGRARVCGRRGGVPMYGRVCVCVCLPGAVTAIV